MWSGGSERDDGLLWDIAGPTRPSRIPGVTMAGFGDRGITPPGLRLIPHPAVTLVLVFGDTIAVADSAGRERRGSFATGLGFGRVLRALRAESFECLQVRLSPVVAYSVLGAAVADLDGAVVAVDDLWGREVARVVERLGELSSWDERFAVTEAWLARRCAAAPPVMPEVAWAWRGIVAGRGTVRVERLATELGWSRKRLWSRFRSQLGLPPKRAARLVRFDHAVHGLVAGRDPAAVAADTGYADQSHLHRDVAAFTGLTPATVVDEPFLAVDHLAWGWPECPCSVDLANARAADLRIARFVEPQRLDCSVHLASLRPAAVPGGHSPTCGSPVAPSRFARLSIGFARFAELRQVD